MNRLHNLDYLRGTFSLAVMVTHYLMWTIGRFTAESYLFRIALFGIAIFYVLSGLTLYYVYFNKFEFTFPKITTFYIRRFFRIYPLLWLATIASIIVYGWQVSGFDLFTNLSGLFGFFDWGGNIATGAWSIGNELVFYCFFPFFVLFIKRFKPLFIILCLVLTAIFLYFTFFVLDPQISLSDQWTTYVNPLNQVFYFMAGIVIGVLFHKKELNQKLVLAMLVLSLIGFYLLPVTGDNINLVIGGNRLYFSALALILCICLYKLTYSLPDFIHIPLTKLGEASYSVYLLHPIIYQLVGNIREHTVHFPESIRLLISFVITLIVSFISYRYFEKFFMKLGRKIKIG